MIARDIAALLVDAAHVEREAILDDHEWSVRATNDGLIAFRVSHESPVDAATLQLRLDLARDSLIALSTVWIAGRSAPSSRQRQVG